MDEIVILDRWQFFLWKAIAFGVGAAAGYEWRVIADIIRSFSG